MYNLFKQFLLIFQVTQSETGGKSLERSRPQTDDETLSLLVIQNGDMAKDKWKPDSANTQSNGPVKNGSRPEHRLSVLSLGYVPAAHPTS